MVNICNKCFHFRHFIYFIGAIHKVTWSNINNIQKEHHILHAVCIINIICFRQIPKKKQKKHDFSLINTVVQPTDLLNGKYSH